MQAQLAFLTLVLSIFIKNTLFTFTNLISQTVIDPAALVYPLYLKFIFLVFLILLTLALLKVNTA